MKPQAFYFPFLISSLLLFFSFHSLSQNQKKADSLARLLTTTREDTIEFNILISYAEVLSRLNLDSAIVVSSKVVHLAEEIGDPKKTAMAYNTAGSIHYLKGDYPGGLKFQFKALKIAEENKFEDLYAKVHVSIGNIFTMEGDYIRSYNYYKKALAIFEKQEAWKELVKLYSNIGLTYAYQKQSDTALYYFNLALKLTGKAPDEREKATVYDFIGFACINGGKYDLGVKYLDSALLINRKHNSTLKVLDNLRNRGQCYLNLKNYKLAERDLLESLVLSRSASQLNGIYGNYELLSELNKKKGNFALALDYYKKSVLLKDSIYNSENTRKSLQQEMKFEYDKRALADSIHRVQDQKLAAQQLKTEQTKRYALYGGMILTTLFSLFMVNRFRLTKRQKVLIEEQKQTVELQKNSVEEKQKEILDSIKYAKRIQQSLLANETYINKNLLKLRDK